MKTCKDRANETVASTALVDFLGAANVEELKTGIKEALLDHFVEDINQYPYYLLDEQDVYSLIGEILLELKEEIINEYKEPLKKAIVDAMLRGLDKDGLKEILS